MGKGFLKLPRRLFGYQRASVDQMIADRDSMLAVADQRVRSAEARIADLEEELQRRDEDLEAVRTTEPRHHDEAVDDPPEPAAPPRAEPEPSLDPPAPTQPWMARTETDFQPLAVHEAESPETEDLEEVEEWPLPTIRPRTVDFLPPVEPSATFDPMPIGGEERGWTNEAETQWPVHLGPASQPEDDFDPPVHDEPEHGVAVHHEDGHAVSEHAQAEDDEPEVRQAEQFEAEPYEFAQAMEPPTELRAEEPPQPEDQHPVAEAPAAESADAAMPAPMTTEFMTEELARVVKAAEDSATKIIERAWQSTQAQISQVDRMWREVQDEIIRFAAWREHVEPMIGAVQTYIEEARTRIEAVPQRIQDALGPAVEAMALVDEGMSQFADASSLPQLLGKLRAEADKAIERNDFTSSSSETSAAVDESASSEHQGDEPPAEAEHVESAHGPEAVHDESEPADMASTNGNAGAAANEDLDIARAIAQELRVINIEQDEDQSTIRSPESY
jgi:hypothetical protein